MVERPSRVIYLPTGNLPVQLTSFVGRDQELAEVEQLLAEGRLVTLTGAGGCGKTRLALQAAECLADRFPGGVWLAELSPETDPDLVPQTVARALGMRERPGRSMTEALSEWLQGRSALLVLDNCEHLIDPCAALAGTLLRECTDLRILATSRSPLNVPGEICWRVPPLSMPDRGRLPDVNELAGYDAIRLFLERAHSARPGFVLTERNAAAVMEICARLDGVPLALELAAARVKLLTAEQIARRLDDRFHLLTGGTRTDIPQHKTLRALIDWSHDLLSTEEQILFRRLSVFRGGWSLEAAETVCAFDPLAVVDVLDLLAQLVDKSLVLPEDAGGANRYRLLETIRAYAAEKMLTAGEQTPLRQRHLSWCLTLIEQDLPQGQLWRGWQLEHDNLRGALEWSLGPGGDLAAGARLCVALHGFWRHACSLFEGKRWFDLLQPELAGLMPDLRLQALLTGASISVGLYDLSAVEHLSEQALALSREISDRRAEGQALSRLALVTLERGNQALGEQLAEQSLAISRAAGDAYTTAMTLNNLALWVARVGDLDRTIALLQESLMQFRAVGDLALVANGLNNLAIMSLQQHEIERAERYADQLRETYEEMGLDKPSKFMYLQVKVSLMRGEFERAAEMAEEVVHLIRAGDEEGQFLNEVEVDLALAKSGLDHHAEAEAHLDRIVERVRHQSVSPGYLPVSPYAYIAMRRGELERAAVLAGAAGQIGDDMWRTHPLMAAWLREMADHAAHDASLQAGRTMPLDQVIDVCLRLSPLPVAVAAPTAPAVIPAVVPALPDGLTAREAEVVRLVAQGLTDKEIAAQLFISPRTVDGHLRNIFNKVGVSTRAALAAYATRHRLA